MNKINYGGISQELPKNLSRVFVEHESGIPGFAFYKDGLFKCESLDEWLAPEQIKGWLSISSLKEKVGI